MADRSGHDCAVTIPARSASLFTLANLPLILGLLSARVLRHSYLIFLWPRCLARRLARYRCSCACLSADCANGRVSTVSSRSWSPPSNARAWCWPPIWCWLMDARPFTLWPRPLMRSVLVLWSELPLELSCLWCVP